MFIIRKIYYFLLDTIQSLLIAAAIFLVLYIFISRPFQVSGTSMYPNFHDCEYVLTNIIGLHFTKPTRGDVIIFQAPPEPDKDFIKRVIGLPGDTVRLHNGSVYINNVELNESAYIASSVKTYGGAFLVNDASVNVPPQEYFVMGDNREYSSDSREWGFVPAGNIIGYAFLAYWPPSLAQTIHNPYTTHK